MKKIINNFIIGRGRKCRGFFLVDKCERLVFLTNVGRTMFTTRHPDAKSVPKPSVFNAFHFKGLLWPQKIILFRRLGGCLTPILSSRICAAMVSRASAPTPAQISSGNADQSDPQEYWIQSMLDSSALFAGRAGTIFFIFFWSLSSPWRGPARQSVPSRGIAHDHPAAHLSAPRPAPDPGWSSKWRSCCASWEFRRLTEPCVVIVVISICADLIVSIIDIKNLRLSHGCRFLSRLVVNHRHEILHRHESPWSLSEFDGYQLWPMMNYRLAYNWQTVFILTNYYYYY